MALPRSREQVQNEKEELDNYCKCQVKPFITARNFSGAFAAVNFGLLQLGTGLFFTGSAVVSHRAAKSQFEKCVREETFKLKK